LVRPLVGVAHHLLAVTADNGQTTLRTFNPHFFPAEDPEPVPDASAVTVVDPGTTREFDYVLVETLRRLGADSDEGVPSGAASLKLFVSMFLGPSGWVPAWRAVVPGQVPVATQESVPAVVKFDIRPPRALTVCR